MLPFLTSFYGNGRTKFPKIAERQLSLALSSPARGSIRKRNHAVVITVHLDARQGCILKPTTRQHGSIVSGQLGVGVLDCLHLNHRKIGHGLNEKLSVNLSWIEHTVFVLSSSVTRRQSEIMAPRTRQRARAFRSCCPLYRKRESQHHATDCKNFA